MVDPMEFESKDIPGFEGLYQITGDRRVISLKTGIALKQSLDTSGYLIVTLYKNNKTVHIRVHREYARAFVPNPLDYPIVMHLDNDKLNLSKNNLLWATVGENNIMAIKDGLRTPPPADGSKKKYILVDDNELPVKECLGRKELVDITKLASTYTAGRFMRKKAKISYGPYKGCRIKVDVQRSSSGGGVEP